MFAEWDEKLFCELTKHLWCLLDGFWRLLVEPGKLLLVFVFNAFCDFAALRPLVPFVGTWCILAVSCCGSDVCTSSALVHSCCYSLDVRQMG